jgi:putative ABC transport system substrate-binding protein
MHVDRLKRRKFITLLGCAVVSPVAARAQQHGNPVIGFLSARSANADAAYVSELRRGLAEAGFVDGKNVAIEFRWANGQIGHLDEIARDLVSSGASLIVAAGGISSVAAVKATSTIPIVFISTSDPEESHVVSSLSRPSGNITGISLIAVNLGPKRVDLLLDLRPETRKIALLVNPNTSTTTPAELRDVPVAVRERGCELRVINAANESEFDGAFASAAQWGADALIVGTDPLFVKASGQLVALAAHHRMPAIYDRREFADAGGLMSYGASVPAGYYRGGAYVVRILKGAKPSDLPVEQAATFELVINAKTAKALSLAIPQSLLARADEVIE